MKRLIGLAFAAILFHSSLLHASAVPSGQYLTNVELMQEAVRRGLEEMLRDLPKQADGAFAIASMGSSEIDWMVENELAGVFARSDRPLRILAGSGTAARRPKRNRNLPVVFDTPPTLESGEPVKIPDKACNEGIGGFVAVRILTNGNGTVANVVVEESSAPVLEEAVLSTVNSYQFKPAKKGESSIAGHTVLGFTFPEAPEDCDDIRVTGKVLESDEFASAPPEPVGVMPAGTGDTPTLGYRVSEMEFVYPRSHRRFGIGRQSVDRLARARIDFRLQEKGAVLWASSVEYYVSDRVPKSALTYLASSQYEFAAPEVPTTNSFAYWEPVVVAGVVGGLVALFYSNQANE